MGRLQRIPVSAEAVAQADRSAADRASLLERVALGLAHEGKNPLHNMVLHVQLLAEKLAQPDRSTGSPPDKHLAALRSGISRVDGLLRAFGEFAVPEHLEPDLGAAVARCVQLLTYEARRAGVQLHSQGPEALLVAADPRVLTDLVAHALVASLELVRDGGEVSLTLRTRPAAAELELRAAGGVGRPEDAARHVDALRRLAGPSGCELSVETPPSGGARFTLSFALSR